MNTQVFFVVAAFLAAMALGASVPDDEPDPTGATFDALTDEVDIELAEEEQVPEPTTTVTATGESDDLKADGFFWGGYGLGGYGLGGWGYGYRYPLGYNYGYRNPYYGYGGRYHGYGWW